MSDYRVTADQVREAAKVSGITLTGADVYALADNLTAIRCQDHKRELKMTDNPINSFDAYDWAEAFVAVCSKKGISIDRDWMVTWFANALMRGFDEHYRRTAEYRRMIRRALYPWWDPRRYSHGQLSVQ